MLYLFSREAEEKGEIKLPMANIYKLMATCKSDLQELHVPVTFEKIGNDVYSRRIDEAMHYLIPFDVEVVNPRFSIKLERTAARVRLRTLDKSLPRETKAKLEQMFKKFDSAVNGS